MINRRVRPAAAVLALVALGVLAGCSSSSSSSSAPAKGVGSSVPVSVTPGAPSSSSDGSSSPPASSPAATSATPPGFAPDDFAKATYTTPAGFQKSTSFRPVVPLETSYVDYFLVPSNAPTSGSVIGIYIYALPADKAVTASTDIPARIGVYNTKLNARVTNPVQPFSFDNLSRYRNYQEGVAQPPNFTYVAYFSFGAHHVMEFTCQPAAGTPVSTFATACGQVLRSIKLS